MKLIKDSNNLDIGIFDGEYIFTRDSKKIIARVDGNEVYSNEFPTEYLAEIEDGVAIKPDGSILFTIHD
jgi:hypothetical protein